MPRAFIACWLLALIAVWVPHYPVGVDLPQHANLFRLWVDLYRGPFEYRTIYYEQLFTPYLLPYLVALPFTKWISALFATKLLLTFMVLATPLFLTRWLRTVGAEPAFGLIGFVVAFGYCYLWGFISCALAIPLMFAYLAEFEAQGDHPSVRAIASTTLLGAGLFFSHGITFGAAVLMAAVSWLLRGGWLKRWRAALHVLPLALLAALWLLARQKQSSTPPSEWFDRKRAILLFSGAFAPYSDDHWAIVAAACVVLFLILVRPKFSLRPARSVPLVIAVLCFVALPNWLASTWLVASRFCVFIHAFAPAVLVPRSSDRLARAWRGVLFLLVAAFLLLLNVRLYRFNRELDGFRQIASLIPAGADVQTLVPETDSTSAVFGAVELGQIPAWISAERGGLIANDSAVSGYFQLPIRRRDVPQLQYYPYVIAHGALERYRNTVAYHTRSVRGPARFVEQSDDWLLFRRPPIETSEFSVVRYGQGWGELRLDQEVDGGALKIAGVPYARGIGTHARSLIRIRLKQPAKRFEGACGMDESAGHRGHAAFRIRDAQGQVLFESGAMGAELAARRFSVAVSGSDLLLEVEPVGNISYAHADWVGLEFH